MACIAVISSLNLNLHKLNKKFIDFTIPNGRGDIKVIADVQTPIKLSKYQKELLQELNRSLKGEPSENQTEDKTTDNKLINKIKDALG